jgi:hypothetical protein
MHEVALGVGLDPDAVDDEPARGVAGRRQGG